MDKEDQLLKQAWENLRDETIQDRIQQLLRTYAANDVQIISIRKRLKAIEKRILSDQKLSQSLKDTLEDYMADIYLETSLTQKYLYTHGILDCVHLMRDMDLIL